MWTKLHNHCMLFLDLCMLNCTRPTLHVYNMLHGVCTDCIAVYQLHILFISSTTQAYLAQKPYTAIKQQLCSLHGCWPFELTNKSKPVSGHTAYLGQTDQCYSCVASCCWDLLLDLHPLSISYTSACWYLAPAGETESLVHLGSLTLQLAFMIGAAQ